MQRPATVARSLHAVRALAAEAAAGSTTAATHLTLRFSSPTDVIYDATPVRTPFLFYQIWSE